MQLSPLEGQQQTGQEWLIWSCDGPPQSKSLDMNMKEVRPLNSVLSAYRTGLERLEIDTVDVDAHADKQARGCLRWRTSFS